MMSQMTNKDSKIHSFGQNSGFGWPYLEIGKVYKCDIPVNVKFNKV